MEIKWRFCTGGGLFRLYKGYDSEANRELYRVLNTGLTCSDLCLNRIILDAELRINCKATRAKQGVQ